MLAVPKCSSTFSTLPPEEYSMFHHVEEVDTSPRRILWEGAPPKKQELNNSVHIKTQARFIFVLAQPCFQE